MGVIKNYIMPGFGVFCLVILFSKTTAYAQFFNNTQSDDRNPKLESVILQLIQSNDPQEFSKTHNIYMKDNRVRVIIELVDRNTSLPDFVQEETHYENKVQALVPVDKIAALTEENNVIFIRTPMKSYPDAPVLTSIPTTTPPLKSGINFTIPLIVFIILMTLKRKVK